MTNEELLKKFKDFCMEMANDESFKDGDFNALSVSFCVNKKCGGVTIGKGDTLVNLLINVFMNNPAYYEMTLIAISSFQEMMQAQKQTTKS